MEKRLEEITVGARFRRDYGDIERLAESIKRHGIIQPLAVDSSFRLLAGGRRYAAAILAGLESVPIRVIDEADELEKREIELEENIERKDLTWQEEVDLKKEIDGLKKTQHGDYAENRLKGWSSKDTADLLGESPATISRDIDLAKAIEFFPELANEKTKADAQRKLRRLKEGIVLKELEHRVGTMAPTQWKAARQHYMIGDALEGLRKMRPETAHLIECDPPYGINIDDILRESDSENREEFEELGPEDFPKFINELAPLLYRVGTQDSYLLCWFAAIHQQTIFNALTSAGFLVDPIPGIWVKNTHGKPADTNTRLMVAYETFYLARKGKPTLAKASKNVFVFDSVPLYNRISITEKPVGLYDELLSLFYRPKIRVVCPFLGSGSFMLACFRRDVFCVGWDLSNKSKELFVQRVQREFMT